MIRLEVGLKVLLVIPSFNKEELVFIPDTLAEATTLASILLPYVIGKRSNRLRQFHVLLREYLHLYNYENHGDVIARGLPTAGRKSET